MPPLPTIERLRGLARSYQVVEAMRELTGAPSQSLQPFIETWGHTALGRFGVSLLGWRPQTPGLETGQATEAAETLLRADQSLLNRWQRILDGRRRSRVHPNLGEPISGAATFLDALNRFGHPDFVAAMNAVGVLEGEGFTKWVQEASWLGARGLFREPSARGDRLSKFEACLQRNLKAVLRAITDPQDQTELVVTRQDYDYLENRVSVPEDRRGDLIRFADRGILADDFGSSFGALRHGAWFGLLAVSDIKHVRLWAQDETERVTSRRNLDTFFGRGHVTDLREVAVHMYDVALLASHAIVTP